MAKSDRSERQVGTSGFDTLRASYAVGLARGLRNISHFRHELLLAAGRHPNPGCAAESICVVNIHKAASTLMPALIRELRPQLGGRLPVDVEGLVWAYTQEDVPSAMERLVDRFYRPTGLVYAPFRKVQWREKFATSPVIAIVRDPRDVLVSFWYSHAFSHAFPYHPGRVREFRAKRLRAKESNPAEYWQSELAFVTDSLSSIARLAEQNPRVVILRYEDMMRDFDGWAAHFLAALGIDPDQHVVGRLRRIADVDSPGQGRHSAHIRKKSPGQYLDEWPSETVDQVNCLLRPMLDRFGYERTRPC